MGFLFSFIIFMHIYVDNVHHSVRRAKAFARLRNYFCLVSRLVEQCDLKYSLRTAVRPVARVRWPAECATYPKCADDKIGNDARGWINLGGVDLRSFSIKSKSVANELSNCNRRTNKTYLI